MIDHAAFLPQLEINHPGAVAPVPMRQRDDALAQTGVLVRARLVSQRRGAHAHHGQRAPLAHPKQRFTTENPFLFIDKQKGERHRETRISEEQQEALLAVCSKWLVATRKDSDKPNQKLRRAGREMHRRLLAAFDTGLRAGEMGLVQVKHIDFTNWKITLPWANAKGGKTTGRDEFVWVMSQRLRTVLEERRFLGDDGFVFGTEDGRLVKKFHNAWRKLFKVAGLPSGLVWHDARHEFVSSLIEEGGTIQEVKEAARHKSIATTAKYMKAQEDRLKALLEKRANRISRV